MSQPVKVGLFVTCLVDLFRPTVGFAAVKLLEEAGCEVHVPVSQTCCGQPAWNSGDRDDTADIAKEVIKAFEDFDYVVAPSGSCAGMLSRHYPELFAGVQVWDEHSRGTGVYWGAALPDSFLEYATPDVSASASGEASSAARHPRATTPA